MKSSFLATLRAGPPPPKVVFLPDALFFTRSVAVTGGATPADAAAQVELALEAISPFPLAQLYYGWFWTPGADRAFVFGSYRRRFTSEQTAAWAGAELVLPAFAALFGQQVEPATTFILTAPEGLTAVHWETAAAPSKVLFRPFTPLADDASADELAKADEERAHLREELIRAVGGSKTVIDLISPPTVEPAQNDREIVFRLGDNVSRFPATVATALDVRAKDELAALRRAHQRDVLFWRVAVGCAAALVLLFVGEFALIGGKAWQKVRVTQVNGQQPRVEKILEAQALANRLDELTTKRLLTLEMITLLVGVNGERKPAEILFRRVVSDSKAGLYTLTVEAQTNNSPQINVYQSTLESTHLFEEVNIRDLKTAGGNATFVLVVTFKPASLKPTPSA